METIDAKDGKWMLTPWPDQSQIAQDLIICRALCDLFNSADLPGGIAAFHGSTAINKLLFERPLRYCMLEKLQKSLRI